MFIIIIIINWSLIHSHFNITIISFILLHSIVTDKYWPPAPPLASDNKLVTNNNNNNNIYEKRLLKHIPFANQDIQFHPTVYTRFNL